MRAARDRTWRAIESVVMVAELLEDAELEDGVLVASASVGPHPDEAADVEFAGGFTPHDLPRQGESWLVLAPAGSLQECYGVARIAGVEDAGFELVGESRSTWAPEPGRGVLALARGEGEEGEAGARLELEASGLGRLLGRTGVGLTVGAEGRVALTGAGGFELLGALETLATELAETCYDLSLATVLVAGAPVPLSNAPLFAARGLELEALIALIRLAKGT